MTTIHFIRHGEVHNPDDILYGRLPDFRLSERGEEQAKAAALYMKDKPIAAIYASPMLRAQQTARIIAQPHNLDVITNELINEIHSPYQGRPHSFLESIDWNLYENLETGYEGPDDIVARIHQFTREVQQAHPTEQVIAVTHGDIVLHAQLWARQLPYDHTTRRSIQPYPATASVSTLIFEDGDDLPTFQFHVPYS
jgi:broad specificity phosphatase PhoE